MRREHLLRPDMRLPDLLDLATRGELITKVIGSPRSTRLPRIEPRRFTVTPGRDQIVIHASDAFKDALGEYSAAKNKSMSEVIRQAVATVIGYDISREPARTRTPKYATPEEAKRAALDRAALLRWGNTTSSRLLSEGEIEAASTIAKAVVVKDYEALTALRDASESSDDDTANEA